MKQLSIIVTVIAGVAIMQSCSDVKRKPSRTYMPDMGYSRAYETYADHSNLASGGVNYNARPVEGTVRRGDSIHNEMLADTTGSYVTSVSLKNPLPPLNAAQMVEAERLYLVNCGICHGQKLDGNGPLHKRSDGTDGPFAAAPANFVDPAAQAGKYYAMTEGTMFHSITYGKNLMGSYASQVSPRQRWMIVSYIKSKQAAVKAESTGGADSTAAAK
jgi:mono/diheme cytochrome c family protein